MTITDGTYRAIYECIVEMEEASSLEAAAGRLVNATMQLVPCDHGGYSEVDLHFDRTRLFSSEPQVSDWVDQKADLWRHHMPAHPIMRFREENPDVSIVRLSDVTSLTEFYRSGIYNDLFREVDTRHQLVMHLGFEPQDGLNTGAYPLALGLPLNRSGQDFTDRDMEVLHLLRRIARPVLRRKRLDHHLRLLYRATLSPDLKRSLMGLGLTERQAEVAFWILKGKSNAEIGTLLDIGTQTARQHSIEIYRRLGVGGRLMLQRAVFQFLGAG